MIRQKELETFQERHLVIQQKGQKYEQKLDTARQHMYKLLKMLRKWKTLIQMNKIMPMNVAIQYRPQLVRRTMSVRWWNKELLQTTNRCQEQVAVQHDQGMG